MKTTSNFKKGLISIIALLFASFGFAQNGFNYKALISENGSTLSSQNVNMRFSILDAGNTVVYSETHSGSTDANGIVAFIVGEGTVMSGDFSSIDWSAGDYFLHVELDTGSGYQDFGTTAFKYVPFAKYAAKAGNAFSGDFNDLSNIPAGLSDGDDVNDADHDATNEIQTLSLSGTQLSISDGNNVDFSGWDTDVSDDFDGDFSSLSNIPSGLSDGDDVDDADADATNEIQTLSISGNDLTISQGNTVTLPSGGASKLDDLTDARSDNDGSDDGSSIFIGIDAGSNDDQTDNKNVGIGYQTLNANTSGFANAAIGYQAMQANTTGALNTAHGTQALSSNTMGSQNTAIGYTALYSNTTGFFNTAIGHIALYSNITGNYNTATGNEALYSNTGGNSNTAIGNKALYSNTTGYHNTASGINALNSNISGSYNIAVGSKALYSNETGNSNVAIGASALYHSIEQPNLVAIGDSALFHNGQGATIVTQGADNTAIGSKALYNNNTGWYNTATGSRALYSNTTGAYNVAFGKGALESNTTGENNTALGTLAFNSGSNYRNSTAIGFNSAITANNMVKLGDNNVTWIGGHSAWQNTSDGRFKRNVKENVAGLDFIKRLRPVTYTWDLDGLDKFMGVKDVYNNPAERAALEQVYHTGFIAQEVEAAAQACGFDFDGVHHPANEQDPYSLAYGQFVVPLVKAVQEQQEIIERQEEKLKEQKDKLHQQTKELQQLQIQVRKQTQQLQEQTEELAKLKKLVNRLAQER